MIKINLLSTKKKPPKKVTELQQQLILGTLILAVMAVGMTSYWRSLSAQIAVLEKAKASADARVKEQTKMLDEVKTVESERKKVNDKITIIEQLKKNQGVLVHLLDELSRALPKGVNITALTDKSGQDGVEQVSLEGVAFANNDIVRFIDNLKKPVNLTPDELRTFPCPHCSNASLLETVQGSQDGYDIYKYKLQVTFKGE
jgi:type IV pilus assembly protein PilN